MNSIYTKQFYQNCLEEELSINGKKVSSFNYHCRYGSFNAIYLIRKGQYHNTKKSLLSRLIVFNCINKLRSRYGIYLNFNTKIDIGLSLPHPSCIVIGEAVEIGKNCSIYQGVTIGSRKSGDYKMGLQPKIKDNVFLGAGSKILGDIVVEDGTVVGANAVLLQNTIKDGKYAGIPASIIEK